ncbi:hypothetical protein LCGC14_1167400 [marine sediment metagenome]|uniref:YozE SAM-like domain-containing protein n=1 Tax=marine sediment metagenome TaxID=412755 RepID=A0A0F9LQX7_9ZZZZ
MDQNVYVAYLCFLDSNHSLKKAFEAWRKGFQLPGYSTDFRSFIRSTAWNEQQESALNYLYESEQSWKNFDINGFIEFLERYGFEK